MPLCGGLKHTSWTGLESIHRRRTLTNFSNAQWCLEELCDRPALVFFLFMNDLLDVLKVMMLLFEGDVKTVTLRTQNKNLRSYLIAA